MTFRDERPVGGSASSGRAPKRRLSWAPAPEERVQAASSLPFGNSIGQAVGRDEQSQIDAVRQFGEQIGQQVLRRFEAEGAQLGAREAQSLLQFGQSAGEASLRLMGQWSLPVQPGPGPDQFSEEDWFSEVDRSTPDSPEELDDDELEAEEESQIRQAIALSLQKQPVAESDDDEIEENVLAQHKAFACPIGLGLIKEPVMAAGELCPVTVNARHGATPQSNMI